MRIYLQWAKATAEDWVPVEITRTAHVRNLPRKSVPGATSRVDDAPGWLCALNCQGITFGGFDHTAVEVVGEGLRITGWNDDPEDFGDTRWATEWTLLPPAPDPNLGGQMNTVQQCRRWATPDAAQWFSGAEVLPWAQFVPPPANMTFHGVWLPDESFRAHASARTPRTWREWLP